MAHSGAIKPTDKAIKAYYATLKEFSDQQVTHEGALETAFQHLLDQTARPRRWFLVPKESIRIKGKHVIPDGTLRDEFNLHRGFWEAKDTDDDLEVEIKKKMAKGYPLTNAIFEDTRRAVLFQNGGRAMAIDLADRQALSDLLNLFYAHTEPDIEGFEAAVVEFKERVPQLAAGLASKIDEAHKSNAKFQTAFDSFFTLCQTALNPNISVAAVDEMLVQHLLTERLIRKIFDNPEFTRRNVIAAEVEKVITALVSKSFNRDEFLKSLDRFYRAIEGAARVLEDFSEKQHFLNTVYERFFQGYSVKVADTHGIVYTPQAIVDFMCASVAEVLETEFGKKLGDKDVHILDPCTGTGNFIVNLLRRIPKKDLPRMYAKQLFANEVMLLPYYIAALNIEHAYYELTGDYESFEGLCFVDTLDLAEKKQKHLGFMNEENTQRVEREKKAPITVIIGNPPYNVGQINENDNNKNRAYKAIDARIKDTFAKDSAATLKNKLYDPYVKFFRWAIDRLQGRDGVVCFISNNNFVNQLTFDGLRKHLEDNFAFIWHVDLHGNVRENPKLSGTTHNVFGIKVGVGITLAVRKKGWNKGGIFYHRVAEKWRREQKCAWLHQTATVSQVKWKRLQPDANNTWLQGEHATEFAQLIPIATKEGKAAKGKVDGTIFKLFSGAVKTNRDDTVHDFNPRELFARIETFVNAYNVEVDRYKRRPKNQTVDDFVDYTKIKWSSTLKTHVERGNYATFSKSNLRTSLYRPFSKRHVYFDNLLLDRPGLFSRILPTAACESENRYIAVPLVGSRAEWATIVGCV